MGLITMLGKPASAASFHLDATTTLPLTVALDPIAGWTIATAALCAVACAIVGSLLMLRRQALLGDAISHAILPGLVVAFLISGTRSPLMMLAGALVAGLITAVLSTAVTRWTRGRVAPDAAMGVVFTTMFALGVILISIGPRNIDLDADCVLYGLIELAPLDRVEVMGLAIPRAMLWLGVMVLLNLAFLITFYKELKLLAFDESLARTLLGSTAAAGLHYGLITLVTATSVASFEAVGSILVIAMLVAPPATAYLLTDRFGRLLVLSAIIGVASAVGGYVLAVSVNTSVAGSIATMALALFVLAALFAPRGMIARRLRRTPVAPAPAPPR
ncbi:MAG: metal ABC transporter permease [Phycisphaerales bacterium]|nr:metal ABC transporter permease [Phycisphaerales bacterium]